MWTTVYVAENESQAKEIKEKLKKEGFIIKLEAISKKDRRYQIRGPEFEAKDIEEAMIELGIL